MKHILPLLIIIAGATQATQAIDISIGVGQRAPVYIQEGPPPLRHEVVYAAPEPNYVWMPGHWFRSGNSWSWYPGYWEYPPRTNAEWSSGHWVKSRDGWMWSEGSWKHHGHDRKHWDRDDR